MTENSTAAAALDPKCAAFICSDMAQGGREAIARFFGRRAERGRDLAFRRSDSNEAIAS
jgi:hypothetical protein